MDSASTESLNIDLSGKRVFVAGHRGLVGHAISQRLGSESCEILSVGRETLDLRDGAAVTAWMREYAPDVVICAAAKVGGIVANVEQPAAFLYDNLMIAANLVEAGRTAGVSRLCLIGSSAAYPVDASQPLAESSLLSGPLDPTHEGYGLAKIVGAKLVETYRKQYGCDFFQVMPTNLYGPGDNFDPISAHVVPALLSKIHKAKLAGTSRVELWGSGKPMRELLYVEDCADAIVHLVKHYRGSGPVNVGSGQEVSIRDLATAACQVVGFEGELIFDTGKPDGVSRRCMASDRLRALGWKPSVDLREGLERTYAWYCATDEIRGETANGGTLG